MRLLSYADLSERWGVREGTLRVWKARGRLPEPDLIISGVPAWKESTIRKAEKDGKVGPKADTEEV